MKWPEVELRDACLKITDGSHRTPPFATSGFPFVTVTHVGSNGAIDFATPSLISSGDFADLVKNDCRPLPGDVLFSKDGTVGKVSVINFDREFAVLSSLAILRPNRVLIDQKYLAYTLRWSGTLAQASHRKTGSALRRIVLKDLVKLRIPLPPLPEQKRIVRILDEAEELRRLRTEADRRTADLIPAIFHDMFGYPATNPKGWPSVPLEQLTTRITKGESPGWQGFAYVDEGVAFLTSENVLWGAISVSSVKRVAPEFHRKLARSALRTGDVLVNLVGASIGRTCIVPAGLGDSNINQAVGVVTPKPVLNSEYLCSALLTPSTQNVLNKGKVEAARANISLTDLRRLELPLPPVPLQRTFAARVAEVRAMEAEQAKSRRRLDDLFQSLLHSAFGGEL
jgi:restriction endonuclease S subunit